MLYLSILVRKVNIFLLFFCLSIILTLFSCAYSQGKAKKLYVKAKNSAPYDVIIVPGFPHDSIKGWDIATKGRIVWVTLLIKDGIAKNVMFSGSAVYTPYIESKVMAEYAKIYGIPDSLIYLETAALHSTENVFYSYYLAKSLGFNKIALATDPFQAKLLKSFIKRKLDGKVDIIPFVFDLMKTQNQPDPVLKIDSLLIPNFVPITEKESFWKRFKGTRGKNIDYAAYPVP